MSNINELRNRNVNILFGNMMVIINRDKNNFAGDQAERGKTRFLFILYCILLLFDISNNLIKYYLKIK